VRIVAKREQSQVGETHRRAADESYGDLYPNKDGEFRIEGLTPDLLYDIAVEAEGHRLMGQIVDNLKLKPGEVKELGDLHVTPYHQ